MRGFPFEWGLSSRAFRGGDRGWRLCRRGLMLPHSPGWVSVGGRGWKFVPIVICVWVVPGLVEELRLWQGYRRWPIGIVAYVPSSVPPQPEPHHPRATHRLRFLRVTQHPHQHHYHHPRSVNPAGTVCERYAIRPIAAHPARNLDIRHPPRIGIVLHPRKCFGMWRTNSSSVRVLVGSLLPTLPLLHLLDPLLVVRFKLLVLV
mmetsp:Transcript_21038/g.24207  ORF Transcript_21038/g.24207 Transcript_21038/m.24207 type:complete len:203 (-) Transcript_21038:226-834(-)